MATISAIKDAVRWAEEIVKAAQTHELKQSARMPSTWKEGSRLSAFAILAD